MRIWPFGKKKQQEPSYRATTAPTPVYASKPSVDKSDLTRSQTANYRPSRRTSVDDADDSPALSAYDNDTGNVLRGAMIGAMITSGDVHTSPVPAPESRYDTQSLFRDQDTYRHESPVHSSYVSEPSYGGGAVGGYESSPSSSYDSGSSSSYDSGSTPSYSE